MNQIPLKIEQVLRQNLLDLNSQGLMHGNAGICIFFYILSQKTGNEEYRKLAEDLLDKVFANLDSQTSTDFESGLAGIGWGIEYLVQNQFAEGDTDEILEEIDNKIFKVLNEESISSFELANGLAGYLFYLINRLKNRKTPQSMAQQINTELLIHTINKIYETVTVQFPGIVKEVQFDLFWRFPLMLIGLNEAYKLNIYNEKISCIFKQWLPNLEAYLPSLQINRIYLATVLMKINSLIPDPRIEKQAKILMYGTDFKMLLREIDPKQKNVRYGWPGFIIVLKQAGNVLSEEMPNFNSIDDCIEKILSEKKDSLSNSDISDFHVKSRSLGLSEGMAGLGLFELYMNDNLKS